MSDDNSQPSPITPIRVSPPSTPSPIVNNSLPTPFFTVGTPSPIGTPFIQFSPRPLPDPVHMPFYCRTDPPMFINPNPFESRPNPQSCPPMSGPPPTVDDNNVSSLLSNLQINNDVQSHLVSLHAQAITDLKSQSRQDKATIRELKIGLAEVKTEMGQMKNVYHNEFLQMRSSSHTDMLQLRNSIDLLSSNSGARMDRLEQFNSQPVVPAKKTFVDPAHYSHIFFSGAPKETNAFCFFMRNTLERLGSQFANEKHKVLWLSGYFRSESGRLGDVCPSYNWWRGLLGKNAQLQGLNSLTASSRASFVLPELMDADDFLVAIESTFSNHREVEDARKALKSARQGSKTVEEFNIIFDSLLYSVDLSEASKCEIYDEAINQEIVKLGMFRGGWTTLTTLQAKQAMAVSLSLDLGGVGFYEKGIRQKAINQVANQQRSDSHRAATHHPSTSNTDSGPMDINAMIAAEMEATGFSCANWRKVARERKLCVRCGRRFDKDHREIHGCPLDPEDHIKSDGMLAMWRRWGGPTRENGREASADWIPPASSARSENISVAGQPDRRSSQREKGKKRESLSELDNQPLPKRSSEAGVFSEARLDGNPRAEGSGLAADAMEAQPPMSAGELFFASRLADMDVKDWC
ncbi:hypothetical protein PGT21_020332 [Puccinia graminis f. sp. tritici]|uniref:Retrotransposon gag domain-containing protein n=1 Tax=Puccinia graminis f. sp. tritici TaxID=56615 RepID=A0A5B0QGC8_PUCGR|nr:hypothetical protein PGT21_020332 [Puccinia graminis f. sp. tritici]